jgi:hypothetical protein
VTDTHHVSRWHPPLTDWLAKAPAPAKLSEMGHRLRSVLEAVHTLGICHRDAHVRNFVLRGQQPLIIDLSFAASSDPSCPCYDIYGSIASGIAVPDPHLQQDDPCHVGVWWDSTYPSPDILCHHFGPASRFA